MFDLGIPELIMVLVVALLVFGPGRLPEIGAKLGKAIRDFRGATQSISDEIQAVTNLEPEDQATTRRILAEQAQAQEQAPAAIQETPLPAALAPVTTPEDTAAPVSSTGDEFAFPAPDAQPTVDSQPSSSLPEPPSVAAEDAPVAQSEAAAVEEEPLPLELVAALEAGEDEPEPVVEQPVVERPRANVTVVRRTIAESMAADAVTAPPADTSATEPSA